MCNKTKLKEAADLAIRLCVVFSMFFSPMPLMAAPGGVTDNSGLIPYGEAYFAFEVEHVLAPLAEEPTWNELEYMLDNPYAIALDPTTEGNYQGWPSYRSTLPRRKSWHFVLPGPDGVIGVNGPTIDDIPVAPGTPGAVEVPLQPLLIHPLNYNYQSGEELRLLNRDYAGGNWSVPDGGLYPTYTSGYDPVTHNFYPSNSGFELVTTNNLDPALGPLGVAVYRQIYRSITVTPGADRIEDDEAAISYNSPIKPDVTPGDPSTYVCIVSPEVGLLDTAGNPIPEGVILCGGDTGEPGYLGFGLLGPTTGPPAQRRTAQYSTPALPLTGSAAIRVPGRDITQTGAGGYGPTLGTGSKRLFDPARGPIDALNPATGTGVTGAATLRKPSLRIQPWGTGSNPGFLANSAASLIAREAAAAAAEGEAADPTQAPAYLLPSNENDYYQGVTRTEKEAARHWAEVLGKALFWDMQVGSDCVQACGSCHFNAGVDNRTKSQLNPDHLGGNLVLEVFANRDGGATPADDQVLNQDVVATDFPFHKLHNPDIVGEPLMNPANVASDANDVMSSMGVVRFENFNDVPVGPAAFLAAVDGVASLKTDIGTPVPDPIPLMQGLRRVEPRHTPTMIGATYNFDNFWDGRARHDFNAGSVFGPSDPFSHVWANDGTAVGAITATRQIIRSSSLASQAVGPPLSEFEMSFFGRNWQKIGKKLLQPGVVPLANQLVATDDSLLGPYSNQNTAVGMPGITIPGGVGGESGYLTLIKKAFYPQLWANTSQHLTGAPSGTDPFDGFVLTGPSAGAAGATDTLQFSQAEANFSLFFGLGVQAYVQVLLPDDTPFDSHMDANPDAFKSFGESGEPGLVIDLLTYGTPDPRIGGAPRTAQPVFREVGNFKRDTVFITEDPEHLGTFVTTPLFAYDERVVEGTPGNAIASPGTRDADGPDNIPFSGDEPVDPLMGEDFFLGSNLSLKNPNYRSLRCGECHQGGTMTDHTINVSNQIGFNDWVAEFITAGVPVFPEPLGRNRIISGFALESEINGNAQDAVERNIIDFTIREPAVDDYGNPVGNGPGDYTSIRQGGPQGQALLDNGVYNLGIRPIREDVGRGGTDPWGWPLSLARLALKNVGGPGYSSGGDVAGPDGLFKQPLGGGNPLPNFDPAIDPVGGGLYAHSAQDQEINPGFEEELPNPLLPPWLAPFANNINVGDEVQQDELFFGLNTLLKEPILEGFVDNFGPFNPAATVGETYNNSRGPNMASWPNVNRVNVQGAFKAPSLRNVELTGPYFHTGSMKTLGEVFVAFYARGGDFPISNKSHRDFLIQNLLDEDEALGGYVDPVTGDVVLIPNNGVPPAGSVPEFTDLEKEHIIKSVIDFLLELTDERVAYERAPFDHPEIFVPLDGMAPENTGGRTQFAVQSENPLLVPVTVPGPNGLLGDGDDVIIPAGSPALYKDVPASGAGGLTTRLVPFLGLSRTPVAGPNNDLYDEQVPIP